MKYKGMNSSKQTILHVIDTTGPGGAETVFTQLAAACKEHGYESIAVIRGPGWVCDELKRLGVESVIIDCKGSFNIRFLRSLITLIRQRNVSTIHSHLLGSNVYCALAGLLTGTSVITTFHGHVDVSEKERFRWLKFKLVARGSTVVVAVTHDLQASLVKMGDYLLNQKCRVIPNGVELTELNAIPVQRLPLSPEKTIRLGCLGNIREAKNYFLAVDFVELVLNKGHRVSLIIAGDDTKLLAQKLRDYITEKNLGAHVTLKGFINDVPSFFDSIDVFLMTSRSEGHPLALTQAMAGGRPILATPSGVEAILNNGTHALISEEHSSESLYQQFSRLTKFDLDLTAMVNRTRCLAEKSYSKERMISSYIELYI